MRSFLLLVPILAMGVLGCGTDTPQPTPEAAVPEDAPNPKPANPAIERPAAEASNAFACDLYRKLAEKQPANNLLFSPYSISVALAMTLEGARGPTADEMGRTLRLPESLRQASPEQPWITAPYGEGLRSVGDRLTANPKMTATDRTRLAKMRAELDGLNKRLETNRDDDPKLQAQAEALAASINQLAGRFEAFDLKVANSLWGEKTCPFEPAYVAEVDRIFGAGSIRPADFIGNYPAERIRINRWALQQTNDRIKDLLPELRPDEASILRLVLVNAIWFKGEWSTPFDEKATTDGDFLLPGGGKTTAKLMHKAFDGARYADFDVKGEVVAQVSNQAAFSVVELPIKGNRLAMMFLAPRSPEGLPAIESMLTGPKVASWAGHLQPNTVHVTLPRYRLETGYSLGEDLKVMGMPLAFNWGADFSAMTKAEQLYISRVVHKAFLEVNEKGAEAAAATAVMMVAISARVEPEFRADRPFLFLIRDTESGMILFLGRVTRPN